MLASQNKELIKAGASLAVAFGGATWEDVRPPLQQALERSMQESPTMGFELPDPIHTLLALGMAARPLVEGDPIPVYNTPLAEKAVFFAHLARKPRPIFVSDRDLGHALQQSAGRDWVARRIALAAVPARPGNEYYLLLQQSLEQDDPASVRRAAELAAATRDSVFLPATLLALSRLRQSWALSEVDASARTMGATPLALARAWVNKLDDRMSGGTAARKMIWVFSEVQSGEAKFGQSFIPHDAGERLAWIEAWQEFLYRHGEALAAGQRFSMRDPAQAPLFGTRAAGYPWPLQLDCSDGTKWPPGK